MTTDPVKKVTKSRSKLTLAQAFNLSFYQSEVDFVIPDLATDTKLCIDPFLLYKSKDPQLRKYHEYLVALFNQGIQFFQEGERDKLDHLIDFPEVHEIRLGYSEGKIRGSGLGSQLNLILAETLAASEALQDRGLKHIEELQLVSVGIGADRISDIAGNILKLYLIEYTQEQAEMWNIPLTKQLPIRHYFDFDSYQWADGYFDLPQSPADGNPILLVPRRMVRILPWINYEDYSRSDYKLFLQANRTRMSSRSSKTSNQAHPRLIKEDIVKVTQKNIYLLDKYIQRKEQESSSALPILGSSLADNRGERDLTEGYIRQLDNLQTGTGDANGYQQLVLQILNYLFEPTLTDGRKEVRTHEGTERRDIIFANEAEFSFWRFIRDTYQRLSVMFEVKNVVHLEMDHVNQTATYLGVRLGMFGFIVTRNAPTNNIILKTYTIFNNTRDEPRMVILILCDNDLKEMIRLKQGGGDPTKYIQRIYREFFTSIQ